MPETIECPHASLRKSKYMLEGRTVLACNNCNPRELIDAHIPIAEVVPDVVPAIQVYETITVGPGLVEIDVHPGGAIEIPASDEFEEFVKFDPVAESVSLEIKPFEKRYVELKWRVEEAQKLLDIKTEILRTAMLKANGVEGLTWDEIAKITGKKSGQAAYQYATFKSTKKVKES